MITISCPNCNTKLKPNKFKRHIYKVHPDQSLEDIELLLIPEYLLTSSIGWNIPILKKDAVILLDEKIRIHNKLLLFETKLNALRKSDYFEVIESDFKVLKRDIHDFAMLSDQEMYLPADVMIEVLLFKTKRTGKLLEEMELLKSKIPLKSSYDEAQFQTIYVTWFDLSFDKNKIRISANKAFTNAIVIPKELMITDKFNINFFRNRYPDAKFKLTTFQGVIIPHRSRGLDQIFDQIAEHSNIRTRSKLKRKV